MKKLILFSLLSILIFRCSSSETNSLSEDEKKKIIEEIKSTLKNYHVDIEKSGYTAELKYLDNSSDFYWVPPGYSSAISYDSVKTILELYAPYYRSVRTSFDTLSIFPLSEELASFTGKITSVTTDTSGKTSTSHLVESGTLIKKKDGWKLLNGQTTQIFPKENKTKMLKEN